MTEAYAIKPCPFCGAEAEIVREGTTRQSMQIACTNCNTQVESGDVMGLTPPEKWHWNKRHPVTVSEKGEADEAIALLKEVRDRITHKPSCKQAPSNFQRWTYCKCGKTSILERIDAYLSRGQG